jgi:hypothetical protein
MNKSKFWQVQVAKVFLIWEQGEKNPIKNRWSSLWALIQGNLLKALLVFFLVYGNEALASYTVKVQNLSETNCVVKGHLIPSGGSYFIYAEGDTDFTWSGHIVLPVTNDVTMTLGLAGTYEVERAIDLPEMFGLGFGLGAMIHGFKFILRIVKRFLAPGGDPIPD